MTNSFNPAIESNPNFAKEHLGFNPAINFPEVSLNKDFIGVWDNVILDDFNNYVIKTLDESTQIIPRSNPYVTDSQLDIAAFNSSISNHIMYAVKICFEQYLDWYPSLKNYNYHSTSCLLQKTLPTEGYHGWHSEADDIACSQRTITWSVYFNDLDDSGETEFLYQKQKIKPKAGRVLIFPGSFTHLHRGNPPYEPKYIATGWLASNNRGESTYLI
tara:strand:+ start:178 stop:825 length:648 start_codon:yes stop_codon:yes gene_type:complete